MPQNSRYYLTIRFNKLIKLCGLALNLLKELVLIICCKPLRYGSGCEIKKCRLIILLLDDHFYSLFINRLVFLKCAPNPFGLRDYDLVSPDHGPLGRISKTFMNPSDIGDYSPRSWSPAGGLQSLHEPFGFYLFYRYSFRKQAFFGVPLNKWGCLKRLLTTPSSANGVWHPSFEKEGKVMIYNVLTFSSSSEESLSRFGGKYPRHRRGGGGGLLIHPSFI